MFELKKIEIEKRLGITIIHTPTLFRMKINRNFLFYALCALLFATKIAYGWDDDEDDEFAEILGDIIIGAAIALCQESAACSGIMTIITLLFIIIGTIGWLCSGCECERPSNKQIRRGIRIGGAYGATRLWRNH